MEIRTSAQPAEATGSYISTLLANASHDVLCLLAGGSALDVVEYIDIPSHDERRTIFIMGDERVSGDAKINNFLQLRSRYKNHKITKQTIPTDVNDSETIETFSARIRDKFNVALQELKTPTIIALLGIGSDGHTAGIFPLPEKEFRETYGADVTYVGVEGKGLTIDSRASFTPSWLEEYVDHIVGYAVSSSKFKILTALQTESRELHERPAELIKRHRHAVIFTDQVL
ncbi:MAG: 6-phosphogluconolactonase [Patescibacteria group bacterium]